MNAREKEVSIKYLKAYLKLKPNDEGAKQELKKLEKGDN